MLDISKAIDTVRHETLPTVFRSSGICEKNIRFFQSYLFQRLHSVKMRDQMSTPKCVSSVVPQGSVLGPLLVSLYTS